MLRLRSAFALIALLLCGQTKATHIYGADFFYEHLSGDTYRISLVLYGDCGGQLFPSLAGAAPLAVLLDDSTVIDSLILTQPGPPVEVTPVCAALINSTTCRNTGNPVPGVMQYTYSATCTVPYASAGWTFRFFGNTGGSARVRAGRSTQINNMFAASTTLAIDARLDNTSGPNSSPRFTTIPTPFYCINIPQRYNQGAVDPDNDSLAYALAEPGDGVNGTGTISYSPGFSATRPLATAPGQFSFDTLTGQMDFTPNAIQQSILVNQVTEYRKGRIVGTASREMTFVVLGDCSSTPAYSIMDTIPAHALGGVAAASTFHVCAGTDSIGFGIVPLRPGADTILATVNGLPKGAAAQITGNNTPAPHISFGWKTGALPPGNYTFFVTYKDNDCPLSSTQTQAYTIQIVERPVASITGPDALCVNDTATFLFTGRTGKGPELEYIWDWQHAKSATGGDGGPWKVNWALPGEKTIRLIVKENKCPSFEATRKLLLRAAPFAGFTLAGNVCLGDTATAIHPEDLTRPRDSFTYAWSFPGMKPATADGPGPYRLHWDTAGPRRVSLHVTYAGCTGKTAADIYVRPLPPVRITNAPGRVCIGDKIFLNAVGGSRFIWQPADSLIHTPEGRMYAQILKPSAYRVIAFSDHGCVDSTAISYSDVEPCCNFAYPNAFTPNNDGRNDRFRAVTYGNHLQYELSIYNNWGQRVYYGLEAKEGWDGNFNGKPCDAGTYFYYLNAQCFTGQKESHKGTLHLVR